MPCSDVVLVACNPAIPQGQEALFRERRSFVFLLPHFHKGSFNHSHPLMLGVHPLLEENDVAPGPVDGITNRPSDGRLGSSDTPKPFSEARFLFRELYPFLRNRARSDERRSNRCGGASNQLFLGHQP
jgi:hypothetical protein